MSIDPQNNQESVSAATPSVNGGCSAAKSPWIKDKGADWLAAIAAVIALVISVYAYGVAHQANTIAKSQLTIDNFCENRLRFMDYFGNEKAALEFGKKQGLWPAQAALDALTVYAPTDEDGRSITAFKNSYTKRWRQVHHFEPDEKKGIPDTVDIDAANEYHVAEFKIEVEEMAKKLDAILGKMKNPDRH